MIATRPQRVCLLFPKFNEGFVMGKVPLGLSYLAGSLMQAGIEVTGHNLNCDDEDTIDWTHWDWYGMTLLTPLVPEVNRLAAKIRAKNPQARIVCGGTHATLSTAMSFKQIPDLDYIVAGEGEFAFRDLVLDESRKAQIAGVYWRNADGSVGGSKHKKLDIKTIPLPEQRVFDHGNLEKRNPFRSIMASRGCPYRCQNCQPNLDVTQPAGLRPPEDVLDEMRIRQERYGETYFGFIDSYMPYNKSWMQKFFPLVQGSGLKVEHHANARSDHLDREMLTAFKQMNISRLAVGIESGVDRVANDILIKRIDLKQTKEVFHIGQVELDVRMHGHFMIGIPGETKDDWKRTLEYAHRAAGGVDRDEYPHALARHRLLALGAEERLVERNRSIEVQREARQLPEHAGMAELGSGRVLRRDPLDPEGAGLPQFARWVGLFPSEVCEGDRPMNQLAAPTADIGILLINGMPQRNMTVSPPMGLYKLRHHLRKLGHRCEVFSPDVDDEQPYLDQVRAGRWPVVGMSGSHWNMADDLQRLWRFKAAAQDGAVPQITLGGGMAAALNHKQWLDLGTDLIFLGFAEVALGRFCDRLAWIGPGGDWRAIARDLDGVAYREADGSEVWPQCGSAHRRALPRVVVPQRGRSRGAVPEVLGRHAHALGRHRDRLALRLRIHPPVHCQPLPARLWLLQFAVVPTGVAGRQAQDRRARAGGDRRPHRAFGARARRARLRLQRR